MKHGLHAAREQRGAIARGNDDRDERLLIAHLRRPVMPGEGPASTPCVCAAPKGVDAGAKPRHDGVGWIGHSFRRVVRDMKQHLRNVAHRVRRHRALRPPCQRAQRGRAAHRLHAQSCQQRPPIRARHAQQVALRGQHRVPRRLEPRRCAPSRCVDPVLIGVEQLGVGSRDHGRGDLEKRCRRRDGSGGHEHRHVTAWEIGQAPVGIELPLDRRARGRAVGSKQHNADHRPPGHARNCRPDCVPPRRVQPVVGCDPGLVVRVGRRQARERRGRDRPRRTPLGGAAPQIVQRRIHARRRDIRVGGQVPARIEQRGAPQPPCLPAQPAPGAQMAKDLPGQQPAQQQAGRAQRPVQTAPCIQRFSASNCHHALPDARACRAGRVHRLLPRGGESLVNAARAVSRGQPASGGGTLPGAATAIHPRQLSQGNRLAPPPAA